MAGQQKGAVVAWFRNDLRVADNPVLVRAAQLAEATQRPLLLAYVLDPRFYDRSNYGRVSDPKFEKSITSRRTITFASRKCNARRARFYLNVLRELKGSVRALQQDLQVFQGHPEAVFAALAESCGPLHIVALKEPVSPEWTDVEDFVVKALTPTGSKLELEWGAMSLYHCDDLPFKLTEADKPSSYSELADALGWEDIWTKSVAKPGAAAIRQPISAPGSLPAAPGKEGLVKMPAEFVWEDALLDEENEAPGLERLGYTAEEVTTALAKAHGGARRGKGGESAAWARMKAWVAKDASPSPTSGNQGGAAEATPKFCSWDLPTSSSHEVQGAIDPLAWESLSKGTGWMRISHLMACGCISARQMYWYAKDNDHWGVTGVVHRLLWREWHRVNAIAFGRRLFWQQGPGRQNRWWREDPGMAAKWREGRTGLPYIDACMRELNETGWLAYKGRKTCAAFLSLNLDLDWRLGGYHFEEMLLDYDVAMNYGNWATCVRVDKDYKGTEFRDPTAAVLRSKLRAEVANDPDARYIKQWVPELRDVPAEIAHAPWTDKDGKVSATDYPKPLLKPELLNLSRCDQCHTSDPLGGKVHGGSGNFYCAACWMRPLA